MPAALLQKIASAFGNSGAARTLQYTNNVAAGSLLTGWFPTYDVAGTCTLAVSDNVNGAWTQAGTYVRNATDSGSWWYFANSAGGSKPIVSTGTPSVSTYATIELHEHSVPGAASLDGTHQGTGSGTAPATGSCPVSVAGGLVLAGSSADQNVTTTTVAAPFTIENKITGVGENGATADDVNAAASEGATFTDGATSVWAAMAVSFKFAAAAAAPWFPAMPSLGLDDSPTQYQAI